MKPKISIIVPVYKAERYLSVCIESILNQTFKDFELILVNDGSPDESKKICENYSKQDNRIRVINKSNGGAASARNKGLDIAKGEYIAFVDSDDFIHIRMLEILYEMITKHSSDIAMCDYIEVNESTKPDISELSTNIKETNFSKSECFKKLCSEEAIKLVIPCNKLYKKFLFDELRYKDGVICEDEYIIHHILHKVDKLTFISHKLYYYLQTENSVMRSKFSIKNLEGINSIKDRMDFFSEINELELMKKTQVIYIMLFFKNYYRVKKELSNTNEVLFLLKQDFNKMLIELMKNSKFNFKERISFLIFAISPKLHGVLFES